VTTHTVTAVEELSRAFKGAIAAVRRLRGRDTHRLDGLSYAQYSLLFGLAENDRMSSRELGVAAELSPATVTQMLDSLEAAGLVERVRSDHDKRVVLTSLTERGRGLVAERRATFEPKWRAALADFDDEQLLTAAAILDRLRTVFEDIGERGPQAALEPDKLR
jgi:DNA-binding MarR family transcriptional regulator